MTQSPTIRKLPETVANQIAAGEVVERPSSVVKELVENAVDSGAKNIKISIVNGGKKHIAVQDDGCGMTKDDAVLSLERQATSKIKTIEDIENITTLGFRGEAIPSIASVSRFSIATRTADNDEGTLVRVNAGNLEDVCSWGCPTGTLVEVKDLFCNVPVRKKFLRADMTEEHHIKEIFTVNALAHPEIAFSLSINGRDSCKLASSNTLKERITDLFGKQFFENLLCVDYLDLKRAIKVHGFIERANLSTPTRHDQYIFVNSRAASAPSIHRAIRDALPKRESNVKLAAILFIEVPPNLVDVNVHPTKREVRFRDNNAVHSAVLSALEIALSKSMAPDVATELSELSINVPAQTCKPHFSQAVSVVKDAHESEEKLDLEIEPKFEPKFEPKPEPTPMEFAIEKDSSSSKPWKWFKFLASTASGYILIETDAGVVTVSPNAARERIAFEKLLDNSKNPKDATAISQQLLIPEIARLSPVDHSRILSSINELKAMGFQIEKFGDTTVKIDAVPQIIGNLSPITIINTIARDLSDTSSANRRGLDWRSDLIARSVARSFAGMSTALTEDGAIKLIEELCRCKMPYVCPRGKPVMIFTSTRELDRKFDRV
jgi:DNA mismatch repair protein MutL